ncbi:FAST kinase domain-containing protein 5, mitochondrial-like [Biomphalaria glabrata]|uniref:FAST kinase domain-containing protein 5, mitochondrial-like n=1 Tax=Biomphalaria glabrata TaxID=6526 RepID=A0A9U8EIK2_BIOGL|nr:FAST kinase domain-containing protein 5, mitochondrial-like [Biomphalaria glabrata]KAI8789308.1 FAST kinase domain-containing protein 5 [Biomphalaria glabrata]
MIQLHKWANAIMKSFKQNPMTHLRFISTKKYRPGHLYRNESLRKSPENITTYKVYQTQPVKINVSAERKKQDLISVVKLEPKGVSSQVFKLSQMRTRESEWNTEGSFSIDKAPVWFSKIHQDLIKYVKFPVASTGHKDYNLWTLQLMTTSELMSMAQGAKAGDNDTKNVITALWRRLDAMSMEERLTVADIFYLNNIPSKNYYSALFTYVDEMLEYLEFTPLQIARLAFHIKVHGDAPKTLYLTTEELMLKNLSNFDMNLIAIICHLFFIGQNRLQCFQLLDRIATRLLDDFKTVNHHYLPLLMKMLRYSNYINISFYKTLGDKVIEMNVFQSFNSMSSIMHFAFTYASVRITHPDIFTQILFRCDKMEHRARIKDIAKIVWACGTLVTDHPEHLKLIQTILNKVKRKLSLDEVWRYPDNLVDFLMGLALLNIYPVELYNKLFHPETIKMIFGLKSDRDKIMQLQFFDQSLLIECPHYSGNTLTESDRIHMLKQLKFISLEVDLKLRTSVTPAMKALQSWLGDKFVHCTFVLPHFKTADLVVVYDKKQKCFIEPTSVLLPSSISELNKLDTENIERVVLQLLSKAQTTYDNKPLGMLHCKTRQLQALGYKVILVAAEEAETYSLIGQEATQQLLLSHLSSLLGVTLK